MQEEDEKRFLVTVIKVSYFVVYFLNFYFIYLLIRFDIK